MFFLPFLAIIIRGQRTAKERSEYSLTVLLTGAARDHSTPETKERSIQWTERGESAPKNEKTFPSVSKVMASVFWNAR